MDELRCVNHPNLIALYTADMPSPVKQPSGTYREVVPLCGVCGPRVETIGFAIQPLPHSGRPSDGD